MRNKIIKKSKDIKDMSNLTTLEVVELLKDRNEEAFNIIFYSYRDRFFNYAMHYLSNEDDADDCLQEIFLKLLEKIDSFNPKKGTFHTWFSKLAINHVKNFARNRSMYKKKVVLDDEAIHLKANNSSIANDLLIDDLRNIIGNTNFEIVMLKLGYDLSFKEIAKQFHYSESKCRRIFYENYEIVKSYLSEEE